MPHGGEREGDRVADQQDDDQRREHQRRHVRDQEGGHGVSPPVPRSRCRSISSAIARSPRDRRISSASCSSAVLSTCFSLGSGIMPAQEGDALDQLGEPLQDQQEEADRHHEPRRPEDQAAGVGRHLVPLVGVDEHRPRQPHDQDRHRQQEEQRAEDVDPGLRARRQAAGDDVDAHVLVVQQRVAGAEAGRPPRTGTTGSRGRRSSSC